MIRLPNWVGPTALLDLADHDRLVSSPRFGLYYAHHPDATMIRYLDANPYDGTADDLQAAVAIAGFWPETLL